MRTNSGIRHKRKGIRVVRFFLCLIPYAFSVSSYAQCAMCRAALEGDANTGKAEAVNDGIVYLMIIPYLLVAVIGFYIYKTGKKLKSKKA